jgi:hypothetical protein
VDHVLETLIHRSGRSARHGCFVSETSRVQENAFIDSWLNSVKVFKGLSHGLVAWQGFGSRKRPACWRAHLAIADFSTDFQILMVAAFQGKTVSARRRKSEPDWHQFARRVRCPRIQRGVGRDRGMGRGRGVILGVAVGDGVAVGLGVPLGVGVGVGVGVGIPPGVTKA